MAGVLLRETSLRELWHHIPFQQACVMCVDSVTSAYVCVFKRTDDRNTLKRVINYLACVRD